MFLGLLKAFWGFVYLLPHAEVGGVPKSYLFGGFGHSMVQSFLGVPEAFDMF